MAKWDDIRGSGNVEDRRGMSRTGMAVGGLGGVALFLLFAFLGSQGIDTSILEQVVGNTQTTQSSSAEQPAEFAGEDSYEKFTKKVLGSNNETWSGVFTALGKQYTEPRLVLFRDYTQSGCGTASGLAGPHYCPLDQTIYMDETFFEELKTKLGGSDSQVAHAYVIAHEAGHHVQNQLGIMDAVDTSNGDQSTKLELQADCFAGLWMYSLSRTAILNDSEIKDALSAAAAVGDDNVQKSTQGYTTPETWTHGSSAQRVEWFTRGYKTGNVQQCDTFAS